ncbi:hypothetical protein COEREDRAFT_90124 [Coemansia reversa NRRL 1564]|uniref:Uncharacterized protein n=1 Tax=Coemansia reversa (strain ATCC 12441 / NRRL 1564) TaxID=763665 RepID=A0A2G5B0X0_COERN|nr:hypothetical protein COEREDRAFT_90124 [Coemansia reversa NRRL 1564]|eukprot:PIA12662.1 hypothetical protein COEREDRAFT_90124 [Coemansia reversa NRRL 1564]
MANNKSNIENQADDDLNDHQHNGSHNRRQIKSEVFSNRIVTTATTTNAQSLPNIKLNYKESAPVNAALYGYADLFAESYSSDSENEADEQEGTGLSDQIGDYASAKSMSPVEATVFGFERSTPRLPVLRIGAARLSEMVHAPRNKARAEANNDPILINQVESDSEKFQSEKYRHQKIKQNLYPHQRSIKNKVLDNDADGAAAILPKRLARAITIKREKTAGCNSQESFTAIPVDDDNGSTLNQSLSNGSSSKEMQNNRYANVDAALNILEKDEKGEDVFNGLLAPGAFGDEKQRAKADGSKFQRFLYMLQGSRREREARLFKPIVVNPTTTVSDSKGQQRNPDGTINRQPPWFDNAEDEDRDVDQTIMSKFPFCCCAARYCVAITFVGILAGAILGFFVWPRIPTLSIHSLAALDPAQVIYNTDENQYGLHMPLRINYEIHSGNFYPLKISHVHVLGFDGVTGNRIIDTTLKDLPVAALKMQFHSANTNIRYLTSDMADPALVDLFGKCAPKNSIVRKSAAADNNNVGRPGALTIRFQISVNMHNLGWIKQPIVTLNQKVECPE